MSVFSVDTMWEYEGYALCDEKAESGGSAMRSVGSAVHSVGVLWLSDLYWLCKIFCE